VTPERDDALAVRAASVWGLDRPVIVRRSMATTYRCGDVIVRVTVGDGGGVEPAIALARLLEGRGIRVPAPAAPGSIVDRTDAGAPLTATAWARVVPAPGGRIDWQATGAMVAALHRLDPTEVTPVHPLCRLEALDWWDFPTMLDDVVDQVDPVAARALRRAVEASAGWRDRFATADQVVSHGDVHPGNVVQSADGPVLLDWDLIGMAPRGWDHAALVTWEDRWDGAAGLYRAFARGYGRDLSSDPLTAELAHLRLLAATLMRVRAGRTDPAAAAEARRRLRWWIGDPAAPRWRPM
jgi:Ser/Thr protein kinase RdoA (MazF antagonist)